MFGTKRKQKNLVYSKVARIHKRSVPQINSSTAKSNFLFDAVKMLHSCIGDLIVINNTDFILPPDGPMIVKTISIKNKEKRLIEKLENLLGIIQKELRDGIGKQSNIR